MKTRSLLAILIAACVASLAGQGIAAEAVGVELAHQDNRVAGYTVTGTGESDAELLALLATESLSMEADYLAISALADQDQLVLDGGVTVNVHRRGSLTGACVELDQLTLVRSATNPGQWHVSAEDVDRVLDANGIVLYHAESFVVGDTIVHSGYVNIAPFGWILLAAIGFGIVLVFAVILTWFVSRSRRSPR